MAMVVATSCMGQLIATLPAEPLTCPLMKFCFSEFGRTCVVRAVLQVKAHVVLALDVDPLLDCFHGRQALMACRLSSLTGSVEKCAAKLV